VKLWVRASTIRYATGTESSSRAATRQSCSSGGMTARSPVLRYAQCGIEAAMMSVGAARSRSQSSAASRAWYA
jgi:hypothetical protein